MHLSFGALVPTYQCHMQSYWNKMLYRKSSTLLSQWSIFSTSSRCLLAKESDSLPYRNIYCPHRSPVFKCYGTDSTHTHPPKPLHCSYGSQIHTHTHTTHTSLAAIFPGEPGLAICSLRITGFVVKFPKPDALPAANQQKYSMGFTFLHPLQLKGKGITPFCISSDTSAPSRIFCLNMCYRSFVFTLWQNLSLFSSFGVLWNAV